MDSHETFVGKHEMADHQVIIAYLSRKGHPAKQQRYYCVDCQLPGPFCRKTLHRHGYTASKVSLDLDGVQSCYGKYSKGKSCDDCPVTEDCRGLEEMCGVRT